MGDKNQILCFVTSAVIGARSAMIYPALILLSRLDAVLLAA